MQSCGLGLGVSVSRCTNALSRQKLSASRLYVGRLTSRSRPFTSRAQNQFSAKLCGPTDVLSQSHLEI